MLWWVKQAEDVLISISYFCIEKASLPSLLYLVGSTSWREVEFKKGKGESEETHPMNEVPLTMKFQGDREQ